MKKDAYKVAEELTEALESLGSAYSEGHIGNIAERTIYEWHGNGWYAVRCRDGEDVDWYDDPTALAIDLFYGYGVESVETTICDFLGRNVDPDNL